MTHVGTLRRTFGIVSTRSLLSPSYYYYYGSQHVSNYGSNELILYSNKRQFASSSSSATRRGFWEWARIIVKGKPFDPRRKIVVTPKQRFIRGLSFCGYFVFFLWLCLPGKTYKYEPLEYDKFFERNALRENVKVLTNGVQYEMLKKGYGIKPSKRYSVVQVHLEGSLLDGTVFTTTKDSPSPLTLSLDKIVSGFGIALQHMQVGEEGVVYIPSDQAYGREGKLGSVPPNTPIIFKVQLVHVNNHPKIKK